MQSLQSLLSDGRLPDQSSDFGIELLDQVSSRQTVVVVVIVGEVGRCTDDGHRSDVADDVKGGRAVVAVAEAFEGKVEAVVEAL